MGFQLKNGTKLEVGPGDTFDVPAGRDAWTLGKEPVVFVHLIGAAGRA